MTARPHEFFDHTRSGKLTQAEKERDFLRIYCLHCAYMSWEGEILYFVSH